MELVHYAPIANEVDASFLKLRSIGLVGLTPQGWLRQGTLQAGSPSGIGKVSCRISPPLQLWFLVRRILAEQWTRLVRLPNIVESW